MALRLLQRVRLVSDGHENEGAIRGMVGCIVILHGDGEYEVEFCDARGITVAMIVASNVELEEFNENE